MLFGRKVRFQMARPDRDGREYDELRVDFDVSRKLNAPPSAKLKVYNLNADALDLAQHRDTVFRIFAGYDVARLIFSGTAIDGGVKLDSTGTDRILNIEAEGGAYQLARARLNVSFSTETTIGEVVEAVQEKLSLPAAIVKVDEGVRLSQGVVLDGLASRVLDRIARISDARWSIQGGALQILPREESTKQRAVVFSAETGNLIGSPSATDKGIKIKGLLDGRIRPGRRFKLQSRDYEGLYKAHDVTFSGSKWTSSFYVQITGEEVDR